MILKKRAAIELSMGTLVVLVLTLVVLILGFVFVRSIMCGAIGFTGDVNSKVNDELRRLFDTSKGEISCIGQDDPISMNPGSSNNIYCSFNAKQDTTYRVKYIDIGVVSGIPNVINPNDWVSSISRNGWEKRISPGDNTAYKPITLNIPENAPEGVIRVSISAVDTSTGQEVSGQKDLDFKITRTGAVRNVIC